VPNVVGLEQSAAEAAIVAAGLVVGSVRTRNSRDEAAGIVIEQNPLGGSLAAAGSSVDLVVSRGHPRGR
jgi:eukaryotic-like serine/threonine-protein kinase